MTTGRKCQVCGLQLKADDTFCGACRTTFCPRCKRAVDAEGGLFCAACGTRLSGGSANRRGADAWDVPALARYLQPTVGPSFAGAAWHCLKNYGVFRGRATRTEFWGWFVPWAAVVFIAAPSVANVLTTNVDDAAAWLNGFHCFWFGTTLLPSLAVFARRLHDVGRSAKRWLASVVWGGVGVAALGLWAKGGELRTAWLVLAFFIPAGIAQFRAAITAGFGDGMREPNRFGGRRSNPK